jgi:hypothetical protein
VSAGIIPAKSNAEDEPGTEVELGVGSGSSGGEGGVGAGVEAGGTSTPGRRDSGQIRMRQVVDMDMSCQRSGSPIPMVRGSLRGGVEGGNGSDNGLSR